MGSQYTVNDTPVPPPTPPGQGRAGNTNNPAPDSPWTTYQKILDPAGVFSPGGMFGPAAVNPQDVATRKAMALQANQAAMFANENQGNYSGVDTNNLNQSRQYLQDLASGKNSVAAEQLRQGLQSNLAAQSSMAAGASPQNSAMAARNAANNSARLGYGMSGQQAIAGLAERNQAQQQLTGLDLGRRQQDLTGALQSRDTAIHGYGQSLSDANQQADNANKRQAGQMGALGAGLAMFSDRRLKKGVTDGDRAAKRATDALKAFAYKYKDEKNGKGRQFGVMAQDLEKAGLAHAVVDTPSGKMVHGAKAATASLGLVAALGRRVAALEGKKK